MCTFVHQQAAWSQDHIPRVALHFVVLKSLQCHYASHPGPFIAVREQHGSVACISMCSDEGPRDTRQMKLFFSLWHTKEESVLTMWPQNHTYMYTYITAWISLYTLTRHIWKETSSEKEKKNIISTLDRLLYLTTQLHIFSTISITIFHISDYWEQILHSYSYANVTVKSCTFMFLNFLWH